MRSVDVRQYLLSKPEAEETFPFGDEVMVFKVKGKMFALLSHEGGKHNNSRPQINLKCDPMEATQLRDVFDDVVAGYHMNKKHWNTLYLFGKESSCDIPQGEIERQIDNSYGLVLKGMAKAMRRSLEVSYSNEQLYGKG
jgi:predicted DNA-binding protein (MmcQ/YjbR family)